MKRIILAFGVRGGVNSGQLVMRSAKQAAELASAIATVLTGETVRTKFLLDKRTTAQTLTTSTHFVSVEKEL